MKYSLIILLFTSVFFSCSESNKSEEAEKKKIIELDDGKHEYTVQGILKEYKNKDVFILAASRVGVDTIAKTKSDDFGKYSVNFQAKPFQELSLKVKDSETYFITDNEKIGVGCANKSWFYENSKESEYYNQWVGLYKKYAEDYTRLQMELQASVQSGDVNKSTELEKELLMMNDRSLNEQKELITSVAPSYTAYWALQGLLSSPNVDQHITFVKEIKAKFEGSDYPFVESLLANISKLESWGVGSVVPEIDLPTPSGETLKLSSLKGSYVLIDFWASWCGPCIHEMPYVKKAYDKYHSKGFDVYGVSLDDDKQKWESAIERLELSWNHVSDLKKWESPVVEQYQISGIPHTLLIDPEGKIVAKNLRGNQLELKLKEVLGE